MPVPVLESDLPVLHLLALAEGLVPAVTQLHGVLFLRRRSCSSPIDLTAHQGCCASDDRAREESPAPCPSLRCCCFDAHSADHSTCSTVTFSWALPSAPRPAHGLAVASAPGARAWTGCQATLDSVVGRCGGAAVGSAGAQRAAFGFADAGCAVASRSVSTNRPSEAERCARLG